VQAAAENSHDDVLEWALVNSYPGIDYDEEESTDYDEGDYAEYGPPGGHVYDDFDDSDDSDPDLEELEIEELREIAERYGLSDEGSREEVIDRIYEELNEEAGFEY